MGRASQALKQVLEAYDISQNSLAVAMGVKRGSVNRWFHDKRDPTAETVVEIVRALKDINYEAAKKFVDLYICDVFEEKSGS
jgi:transcriptional regulator with XRE-family HTH domain